MRDHDLISVGLCSNDNSPTGFYVGYSSDRWFNDDTMPDITGYWVNESNTGYSGTSLSMGPVYRPTVTWTSSRITNSFNGNNYQWNAGPTSANYFCFATNSMDVALDDFFINDSRFKINSTNGILENNTNLSIGVYYINISVNDTSNNINSTILNINVTDTIIPIWDEIPDNKIIEYMVESLNIDFNASDYSPPYYFVNDTNFKINSTGILENPLKKLEQTAQTRSLEAATPTELILIGFVLHNLHKKTA